MKQTFEFSTAQFHHYLLQTISANKSYRLSFKNNDRNRCTLFCPEKAIAIDCHIVPGDGITECYLSATSPLCVISAAHEQRVLTDLISRLNITIHHPVRQEASPARIFFLGPKQKMSLNS